MKLKMDLVVESKEDEVAVETKALKDVAAESSKWQLKFKS